MSDFLMPSLGPDMESARVIEWLVRPGDRVRRGDVVVVVETDKGAIEIEVFEDGVIEALVAPVDAELAVGAVLARIAHDSEPAAAPAAAAAPQAARAPVLPPASVALPPRATRAPATPPAQAASPASWPVARGAGERIRASPAARRAAAAEGLDLATLAGAGAGRAITLADVRAAGAPAREHRAVDPRAMRRVIGQAMARAKRDIPHYYLTRSFSMRRALDWLATQNRMRSVERRMLPAVLLLRAVGVAVMRVPGFNGTWVDDGFRPGSAAHVGWAVALRGGGLIAPAIHDVAGSNLDQLMVALADVVRRARGGGLRSSELSDATITVTSLGERGAETVLPVIHPPQVAMIGFGRIVERPWTCDGALVVEPVVSMSLAADHRVSDGHAGSLLLEEIERLLCTPEAL